MKQPASEARQALQEEVEAQRQIRNLNQIVSHAAGRLDVLHKILNDHNDNPRDVLYNARRFINKGHDNLERMLDRHANGDPAVE